MCRIEIHLKRTKLGSLQCFLVLKFQVVMIDMLVLRFGGPDPALPWLARELPVILEAADYKLARIIPSMAPQSIIEDMPKVRPPA